MYGVWSSVGRWSVVCWVHFFVAVALDEVWVVVVLLENVFQVMKNLGVSCAQYCLVVANFMHVVLYSPLVQLSRGRHVGHACATLRNQARNKFVSICVCLIVFLPISPSICPSVRNSDIQSIYPSNHLSISQFVCQFVHQFTWLSVYLFVCMCVHQSTYWPACLSLSV